jgi:protein-disulfide isomerase
MSFLKKSNLGDSPFVKPIIAIILVLIIGGGIYSITGGKKAAENDDVKVEKEAEIQPSGLDLNEEVETVGDVEKVIVKWVEANPKAIIQAVANMQKKASEDQMKNAQKNIVEKKAELESSDSPAVAPDGYDVTIVEFFDYLCGYCKKAQDTVETVLKDDKKVRFIYKEYPILGQASVEMSQVAVAVSLIDNNSYRKFHNALMKSNARSKDEAIKIAKEIGIDGAKLTASLKDNQEKILKILQVNSELGASIGISGTPGFIIGEELIPGALDAASFKAKIAALRSK